jgi:hypothetical protein
MYKDGKPDSVTKWVCVALTHYTCMREVLNFFVILLSPSGLLTRGNLE